MIHNKYLCADGRFTGYSCRRKQRHSRIKQHLLIDTNLLRIPAESLSAL